MEASLAALVGTVRVFARTATYVLSDFKNSTAVAGFGRIHRIHDPGILTADKATTSR